MNRKFDTTLIFDNGGGVTLRFDGKWAHWFDDMEQAALHYHSYLEDGMTDDWEGHEPDNLEVEWSIDDVRNGSYRIYFHEDVIKEISNEDSTGWKNIDEFCLALDEILQRENTMYVEKPFTTLAHINSLGGELQEAFILEKLGDNDYLAEYDGVKCHAIYNPFTGRYYVDDVDAIIEDGLPRRKTIDR